MADVVILSVISDYIFPIVRLSTTMQYRVYNSKKDRFIRVTRDIRAMSSLPLWNAIKLGRVSSLLPILDDGIL